MSYGIILLLLTGLCWVGIGVVVNHAARQQLDMDLIQSAAAAIILFAAIGMMFLRNSFRPPIGGMWLCYGTLLAAGAGNFLMLSWMRYAMAVGNSGAVWGIVQSAMICPFVMGMVFFGVAPTWNRLAGLGLVLAGILFLSRATPTRAESRRGWLLFAFGAFAASGTAQCLANLPSYWMHLEMSSELRAGLVQAGTIALFLVSTPFRRCKTGRRNCLKPILLLSAIQILSLFFLFYRGLNIVADHGCGSIGYPVAQGSCIAFFLLYNCCVLRQESGGRILWALPALCGGILLMAW